MYVWLEPGRVHSKTLARYMKEAPQFFIVSDPPNYERHRIPPSKLKLNVGLWECPRCRRRVKSRNQERHRKAEECDFAVERYSRKLAGWEDLNLQHLKHCMQAQIPLWLGPTHMNMVDDPKSHFNEKMVCGVWVPRHVTEALYLCMCHANAAERQQMLRLVQIDRTFWGVVQATSRLGGWEAVRTVLAAAVVQVELTVLDNREKRKLAR